MVNYADTTFYKQNYLCGKKAVIDTAFDFYARKATQTIKKYTFNNVDDNDIPDCVKLCCCEVSELLFNADKHLQQHSGISSEKTGDQSVSYESAETLQKILFKDIQSSVYSYLSGTGLLYRGVR